MLGVALGLASLAGINLYLTVFVTGLAIRMDWVTLHTSYDQLAVLGDPIIIGVAGFLFLVEFFADKIPWVDTAWDAVHTFIRPVGAAALAVAALGDLHPVYEVVGALLAGGLALTSHVAKSGTRLVANGSPEPVTNVGLSLAEDGLVLGGLGLIAWNPVVALAVVLIVTATILFFLPRLLGGIRTKVWLAWRKLSIPSEDALPSQLSARVPSAVEHTLRQSHAGSAPVAWAIPCLSGGGPRLPRHLNGWLLGLKGEPDSVFFVGRKGFSRFLLALDVRDAKVDHHTGFLADRVEFTHRDGSPRHSFLFERGLTRLAALLPSTVHPARQPAVV